MEQSKKNAPAGRAAVPPAPAVGAGAGAGTAGTPCKRSLLRCPLSPPASSQRRATLDVAASSTQPGFGAPFLTVMSILTMPAAMCSSAPPTWLYRGRAQARGSGARRRLAAFM